jgi:hypothetical protein
MTDWNINLTLFEKRKVLRMLDHAEKIISAEVINYKSKDAKINVVYQYNGKVQESELGISGRKYNK